MLIDDPPKQPSPFQLTEQSLSTLRNSIIGSFDTKVYHYQNGTFKTILTSFTNDEQRTSLSLPIQNLIISIINSYIISNKDITALHPEFAKEHSEHYSLLANSAIKTISHVPLNNDTQFIYESVLRLLANLKEQNLFNVDQSFMTFLNGVDKLIINSTLFYSICVILNGLCKNAYYTNIISGNEALVNKLIQKFYETASSSSINLLLNKELMNIIVSLTENEDAFCNKLLTYPNKQQQVPTFTSVLTKGIRLFDIELRFLYIKLLTNILMFFKKDLSSSSSSSQQVQSSQIEDARMSLMDDPITMWSISILLSLLTQLKTNTLMKAQCVNALCNLLKQSIDFQTKFMNLNGIDIISKELHELYTEAQIKDINEKAKALKANKGKKHDNKVESDDSIISIDSPCDATTHYKSVLIECLAQASSLKEEARKKITESKELMIYIDIISDTSNHSSLLLSCALLFLSLSRGNISIKKTLLDYDITHLLFKLSAHPKVDIQIQSTSSLCNFLLENSNSNTEIVECVNRLMKIFKTTTHKKIRLNAVFALKNILYSLNSNFEMKKSLMKKITYETLLSLLDDSDKVIQVQALLMFRVLLFKSSEDIDEVFSHCKEQLMTSLLCKLNEGNINSDVVVHSLYVLSNVSSGNSKQKATIGKDFVDRIIRFAYAKNANVRLVCVTILNNLMTDNEIQKTLVEVDGFVQLLEKIVFEGKDEGSKGKGEGNGKGSGDGGKRGGDVEEDNDDERGEFADAKKMAMGMLTMIKNMKKEKS